MKDVNKALRKAYYTALTALDVPVYYLQEPDDLTAPVYVVFSNVVNTDASTFDCAGTITSMRVKIHTWKHKYNDGLAADDTADDIYSALKSTPVFNLDLAADGFQIVSTKISSDTTQDIGNLSGRQYVDRVIIFEHKVYIL